MSDFNQTPIANRLHIGIFGKINAGKSTLLNIITGQSLSIVSPIRGTTTDPVSKAMELYPVGPVQITDTAGLDDDSALGRQRRGKSLDILDRTDLAVIIIAGDGAELSSETELFSLASARGIPTIVIRNLRSGETDSGRPAAFDGASYLSVDLLGDPSAATAVKSFISANAPLDFERLSLAGHLVNPGDHVLLVAPQDIQAPKGRLILPQVQMLRDLLDNGAIATIITDAQLEQALESLPRPDLVICDSQVFDKVNRILSPDIRLTSFSVLFAGFKGDIDLLVSGANAIGNLHDGDRILVMEACTHHRQCGDIATEKLPGAIRKATGKTLAFEVCSGSDSPPELSGFALVVHCGGCMINRRLFLTRIAAAREKGVPVTNFGIAFAKTGGILDRIVY